MYKWFFILFSIFTITVSATAQNCDCESNFEWVKQTFEENDAGFQYVIDRKGMPEYEKHNAVFLEKIKSAKNNYECAEYMNDWLQFFRKGHIGIEVLKNDAVENLQKDIKKFPDWEKMDIDTLEFKRYLDEKGVLDFEGIWNGGVYTVGVKYTDNQYVGFIINSDAAGWEPGQIKFRIYPDSAIYYMSNHSAEKFKRAELSDPNLLSFDDKFAFFRYYPKQEDKFLESLIDKKPYLEQLNTQTLYLRIPSFYSQYKVYIDSIISANEAKIHSTKNLIIDLRYNGGGSDDSWNSLLPIIYTNPIRQKSAYFLSTAINIETLKQYRSENFINRLNNNLGKFVLLHPNKYWIKKFNTVYENPQNIAVIVDEYCASSTEQFLLAFRQSKKGKIFGKVTYGALDFSNVNEIKSPCNDFMLSYSLSKDVGIESYPVDGIGIQPDFYLDDDIPKYKWIDYVNDILNYH